MVYCFGCLKSGSAIVSNCLCCAPQLSSLHQIQLICRGEQVIFNTAELVKYLEQHRVSEILFTPSLAETLLAAVDDVSAQLPHLQVVWLNGEVVTTKLLQVADCCCDIQ